MGKRKPIIIGKKLRGEWAEMIFMLRATEHGLQVSKPWGDSRSYDFVVGRPRHFVAVQVKSTIFELEEGWMCTVCSSSNPYPPESFDFLAAYVVFEDAWYIIPEFEVRKVQRSVGVVGARSQCEPDDRSHRRHSRLRGRVLIRLD
jgi:hypothetical protein